MKHKGRVGGRKYLLQSKSAKGEKPKLIKAWMTKFKFANLDVHYLIRAPFRFLLLQLIYTFVFVYENGDGLNTQVHVYLVYVACER